MDGQTVWRDTKVIIIKTKGDSLPTKLLIGWRHVWFKVTPYIRKVKRCFKCLKLGHINSTNQKIKSVLDVLTNITVNATNLSFV